jgi:hypothetical protein
VPLTCFVFKHEKGTQCNDMISSEKVATRAYILTVLVVTIRRGPYVIESRLSLSAELRIVRNYESCYPC